MCTLYVCFDDTDTLDADRGTGKLARWFAGELPDGCRLRAVVRQQLLVDPAIPYTSHNSAACAIVEAPSRIGAGSHNGSGECDPEVFEEVVRRAVAHVERHALDGSDPGLCVVAEGSPALARLVEHGKRAAAEVVTQADARLAASGAHLSGHGGSRDGIIGAAAGAGLSAWGWTGRYIEYAWEGGGLRDLPDPVPVGLLADCGIVTVTVDRDAPVPRASDLVESEGWVRPRLWSGRPVLPVMRAAKGPHQWRCVAAGRGHNGGGRGSA